ncbi:UDP-glucuronosyltransferase 1A7-like [Pollicipes pollicipes]|uniref:UDP-glucuronosyltransferase 1A7-like n=1 Tax=Pollicipes pollicipes TaxID=41117 RepID=UPI001885705E|nr:UDP-glucuronosyltransferase 1A7-like [Pollicipes pollicipes]
MTSSCCRVLALLLSLTLGAALDAAGAPRLLILHPLYAGSHERVLRGLGERLVAEGGYHVTQLRWLSDKTRPVNSSVEVMDLRLAPPPAGSQFFDAAGVYRVPTSLLWRTGGGLGLVAAGALEPLYAHCERLLSDRDLFESLRRRRFDAALVDLSTNECGLVLARALGLPVVGFCGKRFVGAAAHASPAPSLAAVSPTFASGLPPAMNTWQRLQNAAMVLAQQLLLRLHLRRVDAIRERHFPRVPSAERLLGEVDLVLVRTDFLAAEPAHLPPNVQAVGCIQCREARPLSPRFEAFMESAGVDGVVVFSLGMTGYDADTVPQELIEVFISAFSKLKQKVVMQMSTARVPNAPANVLLVDWLPQLDVLGHRQTRLFVSHCGMGGVLEALYHGVPVLCVPIFLDQGENAAFLEYRGLGLTLDRHRLTEPTVTAALRRLLTSDSFRQKAQYLAELRRLDPNSAADRAIYWINMVVRFGRLDHLRMIDAHLSWFQYWLIDVALVLVVITVATITVVWRCCGACLRRSRRQQVDANAVGKM